MPASRLLPLLCVVATVACRTARAPEDPWQEDQAADSTRRSPSRGAGLAAAAGAKNWWEDEGIRRCPIDEFYGEDQAGQCAVVRGPVRDGDQRGAVQAALGGKALNELSDALRATAIARLPESDPRGPAIERKLGAGPVRCVVERAQVRSTRFDEETSVGHVLLGIVKADLSRCVGEIIARPDDVAPLPTQADRDAAQAWIHAGSGRCPAVPTLAFDEGGLCAVVRTTGAGGDALARMDAEAKARIDLYRLVQGRALARLAPDHPRRAAIAATVRDEATTGPGGRRSLSSSVQTMLARGGKIVLQHTDGQTRWFLSYLDAGDVEENIRLLIDPPADAP